MYCRLITCLEQWMSLLYLYFNQPPSRTGVASRWVVIYFIRLTKELIIATFHLLCIYYSDRKLFRENWLRRLPADGRFKALFLTTFLLSSSFSTTWPLKDFLIAIALVLNRWGKLTACGLLCSPTPYCLVLAVYLTVVATLLASIVRQGCSST